MGISILIIVPVSAVETTSTIPPIAYTLSQITNKP